MQFRPFIDSSVWLRFEFFIDFSVWGLMQPSIEKVVTHEAKRLRTFWNVAPNYIYG